MRVRKLAALFLALGMAGGSARGAWVQQADATNNGVTELNVIPAGDAHFYAIANSEYWIGEIGTGGFPYACGDTDNFFAFAKAHQTAWTKSWNWQCGGDVPPSWSTMDLTVDVNWAVDGNANNYWITLASATSEVYAQIIVDSAPDTAGDYAALAYMRGYKYEGAAFQGDLMLDWDVYNPGGEVSLSWNYLGGEVYEGYGTESHRYLQTVWNTSDWSSFETTISATATVHAESRAHAEANAESARSKFGWRIRDFTLSEPWQD